MLSISRVIFRCESAVHNEPEQQNNFNRTRPVPFDRLNNSALSTDYTHIYTRRFFNRISRLAMLFVETPSLTTTTIKKV
jgi:hypothetical protein